MISKWKVILICKKCSVVNPLNTISEAFILHRPKMVCKWFLAGQLFVPKAVGLKTMEKKICVLSLCILNPYTGGVGIQSLN